MTNENRNWVIVVAVLAVASIMAAMMLSAILAPIRVVVKEVTVTTTSIASTTIVQVNEWCLFLDTWVLQGEIAAAEDWVNGQQPQGEVQEAMIEFARCSEFGKETARLIWPLWQGE